jgi:hypothetical protein
MIIKSLRTRGVLAVARQHGPHHHPAVSAVSAYYRSYASVATTKAYTSPAPFTVSEIDGIKVAAREDGGATTGLSVVLKAGARYAPTPGLAHLLDKFAWKVIFLSANSPC